MVVSKLGLMASAQNNAQCFDSDGEANEEINGRKDNNNLILILDRLSIITVQQSHNVQV